MDLGHVKEDRSFVLGLGYGHNDIGHGLADKLNN